MRVLMQDNTSTHIGQCPRLPNAQTASMHSFGLQPRPSPEHSAPHTDQTESTKQTITTVQSTRPAKEEIPVGANDVAPSFAILANRTKANEMPAAPVGNEDNGKRHASYDYINTLRIEEARRIIKAILQEGKKKK